MMIQKYTEGEHRAIEWSDGALVFDWRSLVFENTAANSPQDRFVTIIEFPGDRNPRKVACKVFAGLTLTQVRDDINGGQRCKHGIILHTLILTPQRQTSG